MKMEPLSNNKKTKRIKMMITESQFRALTDSINQDIINEVYKKIINNAQVIYSNQKVRNN
jgi:hypothetical protein